MRKRKQFKRQGWIYLDLEAAKTPEEVGGWKNIPRMGLAMAVTFCPETREIRIFEAGQVEELVEHLNKAERVIGFNCRHFHFRVLRGLVGRNLKLKQALDFDLEIRKAGGLWPGLNALVSATLGVEGRADRSKLMEWQQRGQNTRLIEGLSQNVLDLAALHSVALRRGKVFYRTHRGKRVAVKYAETTGKREDERTGDQ